MIIIADEKVNGFRLVRDLDLGWIDPQGQF